MPLELEDLKKLHDKAFNSGQVTRERASDDLLFYHITHWDDNYLASTTLSYRGQFDILKKAGRQILADLYENPVQVDYVPINGTPDDDAEFLDGIYRTDDNANTSIEAYEVGKQEMVAAGVAAWKLYTEYESLRSENRNQVIKRKPIYEAVNTVFWDPNAKLLDKSDGDYVSVLTPYSEDGYKEMYESLTGEHTEIIESNFKMPEQSYTCPWIGGEGKKVYVTEFYYREKIDCKLITFSDPVGQEVTLKESDLEDVMDDMIDEGFEIIAEKIVEKYRVTKYIASGERILSECIVAGQHIPVIPAYGEHAYVEGEEHYEGIVRLAKDPQRLRNFQMSYLADIVSRSPRPKPIFLPEQISQHVAMYEENGPDNNYPFAYQDKVGIDGKELPLGPVGMIPETPIPSALLALSELTRQAVEDVANPGLPQDIADPDVSGKAVMALQSRLDMQSVVFQMHYKHAKRRDAEVYASMAAEIYDTSRKVQLTKADGTTQEAEAMQAIVDKESGQIVIINDLTQAEFNIYSKVGPDYKSQKEQTVDRLERLMASIDPSDPMRRFMLLKVLMLMDGTDFDDMREYANLQLVLAGVKTPETPEEEQALQAAQQQGDKPDANMVLAQAEMLKGQADMMREQRENKQMELDALIDDEKNDIAAYDAETKRMKVQVDAQKAGVEANLKQVETYGKTLDNMGKIVSLRSPVNQPQQAL
jgi:hypothetical protein